MGLALFAREGGLNSALPALSCPFRSPDSKVIAQPTPSKPMTAEPMPELAIWLRGYQQRSGSVLRRPKCGRLGHSLVDSSRVTLDLYRDRSAVGISRSFQIHLCSRTSRVHCTSLMKSVSTIHVQSAIGYFPLADQPPRTRSAAPAPTRLKASLATPGWDKGFGSRHVRGDYKTLARFRGLNPRINGRRELEERSFNSCQFDNVQHRLERDLELIDSGDRHFRHRVSRKVSTSG
jgi:hypothetical protein